MLGIGHGEQDLINNRKYGHLYFAASILNPAPARRLAAHGRRVGDSRWEIMQIGRYYDRFVRRGDTWLFSENRPVKLGL